MEAQNDGNNETIATANTPFKLRLSGYLYLFTIYKNNTNIPISNYNKLFLAGYREPATFDEEVSMTVDSVTYNGNYTVTVNVTLPADGYEHLLYLPASAQHAYPVVATTTDSEGNQFNIVDVGSADYATLAVLLLRFQKSCRR
mgnify:CR=1 FL=1